MKRNKNNKLSTKKMKLSTKIAFVISAMLILVFVILIGFTVISTKNTITKNIAAEFNIMAKANGLQVQEIIDTATDATLDIENYIVKECEKEENQKLSAVDLDNKAVKEKHISRVYGAEINESGSKIEEYMIETARNVVKVNSDIEGIGAMFEPYALSKNIESYSFYINKNDVDSDVKPYEIYSNYSANDYYSEAAELKKIIFTDPYKLNDKTVISASNPIIYKDKLYGVIMADINIESFDSVNTANDRYPSMYAMIYDDENDIVYDSEDASTIGRNISEYMKNSDELKAIQDLQLKGEAFSIETVREDGRKVTRFFNPIVAGDTTWWAATILETKDMVKAVRTTTIWMVIMAVLALVFIVATISVVLKKMLKPINGVVKAAEDISNGKFDICLSVSSEDEIGVLTRTFDNTANNLSLIIKDITNVLNNIANKNLNVDTSANYVGDLKQIEDAMKNIIFNLNEVMGNINESAEQVSSGSEQVSSGSQALSQGATEQASAIEELSATIMEISEQIKSNAENAQKANVEATHAGDEILKSNQQMKEMIKAINDINDKSNQIGRIIKTIEDIAFQTNILALNAAVEAARAGSAGKGFAVVAEEVRNLASKSAEAAKNTNVLIKETVDAVDAGTKIANITAESMMEVVEGANKVTSLVDEIAKDSENQASSINQVTSGVEQIAAVVQTNSATAEESAAASEELSSQAEMLREMVEQFKLRDSDISLENI